MGAGNLIMQFLAFIAGAEALRPADGEGEDAEASRDRRQAFLDLMDAHPDAFVTEESFRTALCYFSHRL